MKKEGPPVFSLLFQDSLALLEKKNHKEQSKWTHSQTERQLQLGPEHHWVIQAPFHSPLPTALLAPFKGCPQPSPTPFLFYLFPKLILHSRPCLHSTNDCAAPVLPRYSSRSRGYSSVLGSGSHIKKLLFLLEVRGKPDNKWANTHILKVDNER